MHACLLLRLHVWWEPLLALFLHGASLVLLLSGHLLDIKASQRPIKEKADCSYISPCRLVLLFWWLTFSIRHFGNTSTLVSLVALLRWWDSLSLRCNMLCSPPPWTMVPRVTLYCDLGLITQYFSLDGSMGCTHHGMEFSPSLPRAPNLPLPRDRYYSNRRRTLLILKRFQVELSLKDDKQSNFWLSKHLTCAVLRQI